MYFLKQIEYFFQGLFGFFLFVKDLVHYFYIENLHLLFMQWDLVDKTDIVYFVAFYCYQVIFVYYFFKYLLSDNHLIGEFHIFKYYVVKSFIPVEEGFLSLLTFFITLPILACVFVVYLFIIVGINYAISQVEIKFSILVAHYVNPYSVLGKVFFISFFFFGLKIYIELMEKFFKKFNFYLFLRRIKRWEEPVEI